MRLEKPEIHWNALDVLAHQIVGMTIDFGEVEIEKVWKTIRRCYVYKDLAYEEFLKVLSFLSEIRLVKIENNKVIKTRKGLFYYLENLSMIPDEKSYDVVDLATGMKVGVLHEEFVSKHGTPGTIFIIRGLPWKIEKIEKNKVYVSLEQDFESAIPSWEGELLPVPFEIAQDATKIKAELIRKIPELKDQVRYFIPDPNRIFIENYKDWYILHCPFGTKTNDTLSRLLAYYLSKFYGIVVGVKTDPYRIMIKAGFINSRIVKNTLEAISEDIEPILKEIIKYTDLFLWKFSHVAKRFGVIRKDADYSKMTLRRIAESLEETPVFKETINELLIEKFDIEHTKEVIRKIKNGEIQIEIVEKETLSPLGALGLQSVVSDVLLVEKWREILNLVKERLYNTELYFVCMNCKTIYGPIKVKDYEPFRCEKCNSNYFGVLKDKDKEVKEEVLNITADLLKYYGKRFLMVYAGKGVSYITARRILMRNHESEEELIKDIIEEEKRFFKIRKYI